MLNYNLDGLHTGNIILHEAFIGEGKTTTAILLYVLPAIVDGNNVLICANEQNIDQFRQMILTSVIFNYCSNHAGLNRKKIRQGNYTPEQKKALREAAEWLKRQPGKIQFATLQDYNIQAIRRVVTKMSRMSYQVILIDTLKPEDDASDRAWAFFIEMSKKIFLLAKKTNTAIVATCQLSPESKQKYYLDLSCTGKAKGIAEIAEAVVMFRHISKGEYDSIHPWKWDKEKKMKTELVLDDNKHYIMIFMPKTRSGSTTLQIICEFNQDFLTLKDVGWWEQSYNVTKRRN
jgi:replicative DNA helicase